MAKPKLQRRKDWFLVVGLACFAVAPVLNLVLLLFFERPLVRDLEDSLEPYGESGPGHFLSAAEIWVLRFAETAALMFFGVIAGVIGSLGIPQSAMRSRKLRDVTWLAMGLAAVVCALIAML